MTAMPSSSPAGLAADLIGLVRHEGSRGHIWTGDAALVAGADAARNLADVVHHMALLHARHPGLIDIAGGGALLAPLRDAVVDGFAAERHYLAELVVAVGPLPGTPGQAHSETAIIGLHHALETLGQSDRTGCACGAAAALLLDWPAVRAVLDTAARRFGVVPLRSSLPSIDAIAAAIDAGGVPHPFARAIGFGARQFLLQHRGLWDLLEARAHARSHR